MEEIIDCHAHIFPRLEEACGFESAELHLLFQQWAMHNHTNQPIRQLATHKIVNEKPLWTPGDWSTAGRTKGLNFRVGQFGRFEWDQDGESFYIQFLPPSLQDMQSPAGFLLTQMDHAGIQMAVLQNDHIYGNLNQYFGAAVKTYPQRFIGLAQVEEGFAYRDDQLEILTSAIQMHGLSGLYFSMSGFFRSNYSPYYDAVEFHPFWSTVERLKIPVFWVFAAWSPFGGFLEEMKIFRRWLDRYPAIPCVLVHGIPTSLFADDSDRLALPEEIISIMDHFPVYSEILYPISWGGRMEYPYHRAAVHTRQLFDRFGSHRLLWGSDMPNVERYCTYRQSLTYFQEHSEYLTDADRSQILCGTALSLFGRRQGETSTR